MNTSRLAPIKLAALAGVVAIIASACGASSTPAADGRAEPDRRADGDAGDHHPGAHRRRARPERGRRRPLVHRSRRRHPARPDRTRAGLRDGLQRVAEGCLPVGGDRRQHGCGEHPQDRDRLRQRAGHHRTGRGRGPEPLPRSAGRPGAAGRQGRLHASRASIPSSSTSSRWASTMPRSAFRSRSTRRSSSTTRPSSTRPISPTRRARSVTCTRASRGTWTPSDSWA